MAPLVDSPRLDGRIIAARSLEGSAAHLEAIIRNLLGFQPTSRAHAWLRVALKLAPGVAVSATFVTLAIRTWRRWPDLLVDFGQQLYVPWRLASGERLQETIVLLHGPLSQHLNALWFTLFGTSFTVLIVANLAALALLTGIVWWIVRLVGTPLTATISCLVLLCVFGFSQYVRTGNYNFIAPYTHEATHGTLLAAGMILALARALTKGGWRPWAGGGVCLGLICLTKIDLTAAALVTAAVGCACAAAPGVPGRRGPLWFVAGACVPPVTFLFYFLSYLPAGQAVRAVGGAFAAVSGEVARNPFYRQVAGLDDPLGNLRRMVIMAGAIGGLVLLGIAADVVARRYGPRVQASVAVACGSLAFCVLVIRAKILPWLELPRALPLTTAAILIVLLILLGRSSVSVESRGTLFPALLATTFSLALLVKSTLYLHVYHYGFYLALPSTVALVVCCLEGIPRLLERRGGGRVFRGLAVGVAAAGMILHVNLSQRIYGAKTYPVGRGGDRIVTYAEAYDDSGPIVAAALEWIERNTSPGESLVGLPEGIMLNYLARRPTRTPCMNFMMTEMIQFGEHELLTSLRADPPDYVAIVHKDTSEFGVRFFGQDARYGQAIMTWLESRYRTVARFGAEPLQDRRFGIRILKRIEGPEAAP